MPKHSEAIQLAEASDWRGLQRLVEKRPASAQELGDYGMLPIHWACTESHVPVGLLTQLLTAYPAGARVKNDAALLPLHIAIRARVEPEWLTQLVAAYPQSVRVRAPDGQSVIELAEHVGLGAEGLRAIRRALDVLELGDPTPHYPTQQQSPSSSPTNNTHARDLEDDDRWSDPLAPGNDHHAKVSPIHVYGSGNNNKRLRHKDHELDVAVPGPSTPTRTTTPVSPAHSLRSVSSCSDILVVETVVDDDDDDADDADGRGDGRERGPLISPSSSSSSNARGSPSSVNTAPILGAPRPPPASTSSSSRAPPHHGPRQSMAQPPPQSFPTPGASQRKHSLDYHAHAAAAAAAARQHQEMMMLRAGGRGPNGGGRLGPGHPQQRSMSLLGGRHQSLPVIPSFEHVQFSHPTAASASPHGRDHFGEGSSEEDDEDNNNRHRRRSSVVRALTGNGVGGHRDSAQLRSFESPPEWKRDDECSICRASFGMFKHRHHCRNCGKSICSQHSADKKIMMAAKGFTSPQRVCVTCYAMITHKQAMQLQQAHHHLDPTLDGATITGPVAAFHQQMQQQQQQQQQQHTPPPTLSSLSSVSRSLASTGAMSSPGPIGGGPGRASLATTATGHSSKDKVGEAWLVQAQLNELRHLVATQQKQLEQLTQSNMQMQQQLLEQEELKAETTLLITQLMTRVSVLELHQHHQGKDTEDDPDDGAEHEEEHERLP